VAEIFDKEKIMTRPAEINHVAIVVDTSVPDSALTRDEIIARNLEVVAAHFHNENPETVEQAIALYADNISWEAPTRGIIMTDKDQILEAYRGIFRSVHYHNVTPLRRFATEKYVYDDHVAEVTLVGEEMPNVPYPVGTRMRVRLTHVFEMKDGKIEREIAYEMFRKAGASNAVDNIPADAEVIYYSD
jgi:ketosteroid isomerase-like protein